ncbi:MAG: CPBP family intramembrane metalloprotease [Anaerolineae bacterium]|nr:CPBP family intramembrane metalloprotease [Anaerolineae bacterium]
MSFLAATEQGKNGAWRYLVGTSIILVAWLVVGSAPLLLAMLWAQTDNNPATGLDPVTGLLKGVDPLWGGYLLPNLSFPIFLLGIWVAVHLCHGRGLRSLVTPAARVNWQRLGLGFGLWFVLAGISTGWEVLLYPAAFSWAGIALSRYAGFLLLALIFTPLQTSTEELFFRGYLLQGIGRWLRADQRQAGRWAVVVLNGVLFGLPHMYNPEVSRAPLLLMAYYVSMGLFFAWMTLRDGTAELALGAHAANNLFVALLFNYEGSALQTPALVTSARLGPVYNLVTFGVSAAVFAWLTVRRPSRALVTHNGEQVRR